MAKIKNIFKPAISWINKNANFRPLLKSRLILYFLFVLSLFNLYGFAVLNGQRDIIYAAVFILVGYLTTFFSRNMIVILFCALAAANILKYGLDIRVRDGFTEGNDYKDKKDVNTDKEPDNKDEDTTNLEKSANKTENNLEDKKEDKKEEKKREEKKREEKKEGEDTSNKNLDLTKSSDMIDKVQKMVSSPKLSDMKDKLKTALESINNSKTASEDKKKDFKAAISTQLELLDKVGGMSDVINNAKSAMEKIKDYN